MYTFVLRTKPFSINAATYSDARTKTREYHDWQAGIFHQLSQPEHQLNLKLAREAFDESAYSVKLTMTAFYPRQYFVTKDGNLSARTMDLSNWEKLLQDLFFDAQYFDRPTPRGCNNLGINDKHVVELTSRKLPHDLNEHLIEIIVEYVPRPF
jgi:hypothetical protein